MHKSQKFIWMKWCGQNEWRAKTATVYYHLREYCCSLNLKFSYLCKELIFQFNKTFHVNMNIKRCWSPSTVCECVVQLGFSFHCFVDDFCQLIHFNAVWCAHFMHGSVKTVVEIKHIARLCVNDKDKGIVMKMEQNGGDGMG